MDLIILLDRWCLGRFFNFLFVSADPLTTAAARWEWVAYFVILGGREGKEVGGNCVLVY